MFGMMLPRLRWGFCLLMLILLLVPVTAFAQEGEPTDSDGDGIIDDNDACPFEVGAAANDGCPEAGGGADPAADAADAPALVDSDGDGVLDSVDQCPFTLGSVGLGGCPAAANVDPGQGGNINLPGGGLTIDTDGDGVRDALDNCPGVVGTVGGCPNVFGSAEPFTDSDNDGLVDTSDACPNTFALTADGCPGAGSGGGAVPPPGAGGGAAPAPVDPGGTCPESLPTRLAPGDEGEIAAVYSTLRTEPAGAAIERIAAPDVFIVVEGPVCANGLAYYRIDYGDGRSGWALESQRFSIFGNNRYWLEPR